MPGTVMLREEVVEETLIDVMLGLWNDGFRKQIIVNNHGHLWMLESALQKFLKRYQLPGVFRVIDWHRAVKRLLAHQGQGGEWDTQFIHADEAETSVGLLLLPRDGRHGATRSRPRPSSTCRAGHFDNSVDGFNRPQRWSEGEGHFAIEFFGTPEGVVGKPTLGDAAEGQASGGGDSASTSRWSSTRSWRPSRPAPCRRSRSPPSARRPTWSPSCGSR